jgi:hypothetical protein
VAGEVFGEELLGGAELNAGSAGWGINRRRLPPARCSRRKTVTPQFHEMKPKPPYVCPGCSNHTYDQQYGEQIKYLN